METEAYFIAHCDNDGCNLGIFQYTCPHCNEMTNDYEVWWEQDVIWGGQQHEFNCEKCKKSLIVKWNAEDIQFLVF